MSMRISTGATPGLWDIGVHAGVFDEGTLRTRWVPGDPSFPVVEYTDEHGNTMCVYLSKKTVAEWAKAFERALELEEGNDILKSDITGKE